MLAHELRTDAGRLRSDILHELLKGPKRFRDLRPLLGGKSDTPLTRALAKLAEQGLIRQGLDFAQDDDHRYYAPTGLGVAVVLKSHEFAPTEAVLAEMRAAGILA